ncbi:MAG: UDP-N-acetylmuramoyl-tripeptide--D-alanyl-D-alanine ligase [Dissulfurispiraceae bacterium]|jgi:UDP-N-acetylmuramoyl-tripeptide--D-alanyl-D-alanine ligase|nr:UDP-N-acetylmuramoyl-tripeptide--D-alanyl-D-alanine ligase [Dissulfurispiraceae bacterium]
MLTADFIASSTEGKILSCTACGFSGVSIDSRTAVDGELFIPLCGDRFDGHDFLQNALKSASGALVSRSYADKAGFDFKGKTIIVVEDTLRALHDLAHARRAAFSGAVVAVVGSNGKTTTKEITSAVLSSQFRVHRTAGNFNNHIGLPLTILRMPDSTEALVLEMGTNRPGDINELCSIALPDTAVITNIGFEHIEGFGTINKVRESELEIMPFIKTAIYNADDSFLAEGVLARPAKKMFSYGIEAQSSDIRAADLIFNHEGIRFRLVFGADSIDVRTKLPGRFNVYNCLAGSAAGIALGLSLHEIKHELEKFEGVPMRCRIVELAGATFIDDVYNANPSSMTEALRELSRRSDQMTTPAQRRRTVAVLGDMLELGYYGVEAHKNIGQLMNELGVELFVAVGPLMELAAEVFTGRSIIADTAEHAAEILKNELKQGDVVLLKGSRSMKMEMVLESPIIKEEAKNAI